MRALFVLQGGQFVYGASRSIENLLTQLEYDYDLMICKSFTVPINETEIRKQLGNYLKNIYICWLPRYRCYEYDKQGIISEISHALNNIMAFLFAFKKNKIIKKNKYDYIHLNSLVFFPLINKRDKYIIHVREILRPEYHLKTHLYKHMKLAAGIIFIDISTKESIITKKFFVNGIVLNNPFNMKAVEKKNYLECMKRYGLADGKVVYSMLGQIGKSKGTDVVVEAFHSSTVDAYLLIVGSNNHAFAKELQKKYFDDNRIIFCGEEKDNSYIYRISDYVIRGENQYCIGRTIFEGLYAGCSVIIPGEKKDITKIPDNGLFVDRIFFYEPSDIESLKTVITKCANLKVTDREYRSNSIDYVEKYKQYMSNII